MPQPMVVHGFFEVLGTALGVAVYSWLRVRRGDAVDDRARLSVIVGAAIGATVGARLLWWIGEPGIPISGILGGKTVVGGLLGGLIGVEVTKWIRGIHRSTGDLFVLPLIVAIAVGRIGCFLAGPFDRTNGLPSDLPWAIAIGDGIPRHPVALYEIAFLAALIPLVRVATHPGGRFQLFLASYLAFRLAIDFLKPYPAPVFAGLSAIQWACVAGLSYYAVLFARRIRLREASPA
jgi:prolipoprotein diacylglyceryltransferase